MSVGTAPMTVEDLLAMPDDGIQRWLIRGELREGGMTQRNRFHGKAEARFAQLLGNWVDSCPEPRGEIYSGETGAILHHDPDTSVGLDVMYVGHDVAEANPDHTQMVDGVPILAVEDCRHLRKKRRRMRRSRNFSRPVRRRFGLWIPTSEQ